MEFREKEAIYLQIADHMGDNIITGKWRTNEKIASVRDLAIELEVNPNTVMRSYELLQQQEVIYNKRGIGFFVSPEAVKIIKTARKERFLKQELPELFKTMVLLGVTPDDIRKKFEQFIQK